MDIEPGYALEKRRFNLIDEPWIRTFHRDGTTREIGLRAVFEDAAEIARLSNELPTIDIAITRILLAILYRSGGTPSLANWQALRDTRNFTTAVEYLDQHRDQFWLFDPARPFFQTPIAATVTADIRADTERRPEHPVTRILPEHESNHGHRRTLSSRVDPLLTDLPFGEAARWLVAAQSFDKVSLTAAHAQTQPGVRAYPKPSPLTRGSVIMATGPTLADTLLANLVYSPDLVTTSKDDRPAWERAQSGGLDSDIDFTDKDLATAVMTEAVSSRKPTGVCDVLTWQPRRFSLITEGDRVVAVTRAPGDVISKPDAVHLEPMLAWKDTPKGHTPVNLPSGYTSWTGSGVVVATRADEHVKPAPVTLWTQRLASRGLATRAQFEVATVHWADQKARYRDLTYHTLAVDPRLLAHAADTSSTITAAIDDALKIIDSTVKAVTEAGRGRDGLRDQFAASVADIWTDFCTSVAAGTGGRGRRSRKNPYPSLRAAWLKDVTAAVTAIAETEFNAANETRFFEHGQNRPLGEIETWYRRSFTQYGADAPVHAVSDREDTGLSFGKDGYFDRNERPVLKASWRRHVTVVPRHVPGKPFSLTLGELTDLRGVSVQRRARQLADTRHPEHARVHLRALIALIVEAGLGFDHDSLAVDLQRIHDGDGTAVLRAWGRDGFARSTPTRVRA